MYENAGWSKGGMKRKFFKMMSDVARKNEQSKNITCQLFFFFLRVLKEIKP